MLLLWGEMEKEGKRQASETRWKYVSFKIRPKNDRESERLVKVDTSFASPPVLVKFHTRSHRSVGAEKTLLKRNTLGPRQDSLYTSSHHALDFSSLLIFSAHTKQRQMAALYKDIFLFDAAFLSTPIQAVYTGSSHNGQEHMFFTRYKKSRLPFAISTSTGIEPRPSLNK